jgi:hypothetical protein
MDLLRLTSAIGVALAFKITYKAKAYSFVTGWAAVN